MKETLKKCIPTVFFTGKRKVTGRTILTSFALQRSGQHLVIEWLCRGLPGGAIHFNNCNFQRLGLRYHLCPYMGRRIYYARDRVEDLRTWHPENLAASLPDSLPRNLFYSMEDLDPLEARFRKLLRRRPWVVLILRDPANWLASSMRHGLHTPKELRAHKDLLKRYLRIALGREGSDLGPVVLVNYNRFIVDPGYRAELAGTFPGLELEQADAVLEQVPVFGGETGFESEEGPGSDPNQRWRLYAEDRFFASTLKDRELLELAEAYFGDIPALEPLRGFVSTAGGPERRPRVPR